MLDPVKPLTTSTPSFCAAAELAVLEEIVAGDVPSRPVKSGAATRIMTGAPIPYGADAVVRVEETELVQQPDSPQRVRINSRKITPGQNILRQGAVMRRGDVVLAAGHAIRPCDIGLLAEVGCDPVSVCPRPTVAVLSTGNELVPAGQTPGPGQIRNSNGPMLTALATSAGAVPRNLGIGRDEPEELRRLISQGLECDVLLLSGGVSAGVLDLAPAALLESGVEQVFHKVKLKPGKPLWFGVKPASDPSQTKLVFGLPGNPVSSFVCFELFVRPALGRLAGCDDLSTPPISARLAVDHLHKGNRPTYFPAVLREEDGRLVVAPVSWKGSADLRSLADANALVHFPAGDRQFNAGDQLEVIKL